MSKRSQIRQCLPPLIPRGGLWTTGLALVLMIVLSSSPASRIAADDTGLLRFNSQKPYLFILLDTSTSMNLDIQGNWVEANADDQRSRMRAAKEALFNVFNDATDVHFGFATYNQDQLRVKAKHWLYRLAETPDNQADIGVLETAFPNLDYPALGTDLLTLGQRFPQFDPNASAGGPDPSLYPGSAALSTLGTACNDPIDLSDRDMLNRVPKGGFPGEVGDSGIVNDPRLTTIWVAGTGQTRYRLRWGIAPATSEIGAGSLEIGLEVREFREQTSSSDPCPAQGDAVFVRLDAEKVNEFLMWDNEDSSVDLLAGGGPSNKEDSGGFWEWQDAAGEYHCGLDKPHSGFGWEGNYDSGLPLGPDCSSDPAPCDDILPANDEQVDVFCNDSTDASCYYLKRVPTVARTEPSDLSAFREMDIGDMIPFHWEVDNRETFMNRIAPILGGTRQFGAATLFEDAVDPTTGHLKLKTTLDVNGNPVDVGRPIVAAGMSGMADALLDFRCWYSKDRQGDSRCSIKGNNNDLANLYTLGYEELAQRKDPEWTCRKSALIIITDGENNCSGAAPVSEVNTMDNKAFTPTWILNVGTRSLNSIVATTNGFEVFVDSQSKLEEELQNILGTIREQARAFASAAVPSVRVNVADKIYLTEFIPLRGESIWDGHLRAFKKPLPLDDDNKPDIARDCADNPPGCFLWDAGEVLKSQAPDPTLAPDLLSDGLPTDQGKIDPGTIATALKLGGGFTQRRVYYGRPSTTNQVPMDREFFAPPAEGENEMREELWELLGLGTFDLGAQSLDQLFADPILGPTAEKAHDIFRHTYARKVSNRPTPDPNDDPALEEPFEYVFGEIFHSNPLILGSPNNVQFFIQETEKNFPGYRDFARQHQFRRRVLVVGANDGMYHGFDAGMFDTTAEEFNDGTGRELFAVVPRSVMPAVGAAATSIDHQWSADGIITGGDVLIDVEHNGTPNAADREWRTVLMTGMRRGGHSYIALDVTKPDPLQNNPNGETCDIDGDFDCVPAADPTQNSDIVPLCHNTTGSTVTSCDQLEYPTILWEITDPDLGETWSKPSIGAIQVGSIADPRERYVAIFGGGRDPGGDLTGGLGEFIYMVDMETGELLYKRPVVGSAAAEVAAVDTDNDGYLDTIYAGTLMGLMYKLDIGEPAPIDAGTGLIDAAFWDPKLIFDTTGIDSLGNPITRSIYFRPSVFFVARLGRYGLAFGTGNREDLWAIEPEDGNRFYAFIDDTNTDDPTELPPQPLPYTEAQFDQILRADGDSTEDLLLDRSPGFRGWYLVLESFSDEKVITPPTTISGLLIFSTWLPIVCNESGDADCRCQAFFCEEDPSATNCDSDILAACEAEEDETPPAPAACNSANGDKDCAKGEFCDADSGTCQPDPPPSPCRRRGTSRNYTLFLNNANAVFATRSQEITDFVTEPFTEQALTKNVDAANEPDAEVDDLCDTETIRGVVKELKDQLFAPTCKFGNSRVDIKTVQANTGMVCIASVPVCVIQKNWKEH